MSGDVDVPGLVHGDGARGVMATSAEIGGEERRRARGVKLCHKGIGKAGARGLYRVHQDEAVGVGQPGDVGITVQYGDSLTVGILVASQISGIAERRAVGAYLGDKRAG